MPRTFNSIVALHEGFLKCLDSSSGFSLPQIFFPLSFRFVDVIPDGLDDGEIRSLAAPPSDIGGDVRGCLSGSPGLNTALLMSPASDEVEDDDGVLLLLLLLLYMIFLSLFSPVRLQLSPVRRE